jgi:hypothetical protein
MKEKLRPETIIISGTSRLPENVTSHHVFGFFTIDIEIDSESETIVDFACTLVPKLVEKVLSDSMVGYLFDDGIKNAIEKLEKRFYGSTKRAIISGIEDAYKWHHIYRSEHDNPRHVEKK